MGSICRWEIVGAPCRIFHDETCLFVDGRPDNGACAVCKSVAFWEGSKAQYVMVREIRGGRGLYVFPVSSASPNEADRENCVLELRIAGTPLRDIRRSVNTYLLAAEESWIQGRNECVRVR